MFKKSGLFLGFFVVVSLLFSISCSKKEEHVVWVYTSMYPANIADFDKVIREKLPELNVKWFQGGSEDVAARIAMETVSGNLQADLILVSDYFWYNKMAREDFWQPYTPKTDYEIPANFRSADNLFATVRIPTMVIAYNTKYITAADAPKSFKELAEPKWKSKASSGSPMESGTSYGLMTNLAYRYGYDFIKELRANDMIVSGGNSNALRRLVSGERPVAMLLLENALAEMEKNPNIAVMYPDDGAILMPSPIGITKVAKNVTDAQRLYDFFMSQEGQEVVVKGYQYSLNPKVNSPKGARPFPELVKNTFEFSESFAKFMRIEEPKFKDKFAEIMFQ